MKEMKGIHGGDIYRNNVFVDFSVNVNPLGVPHAVKQALIEAVELCHGYPDISASALYDAVAESLLVEKENLIFGNGASELFMAIVHAIKPKKTVIPIPSFYGYEYAAGAVDGEILYYQMEESNAFALEDLFFEVLTEDVDLLFLANPNNPTGKLLEETYLHRLLTHCQEKGIYVVLDECFIEFCKGSHSMISQKDRYDHLLLIRAYTKIFAIPGVRLGYAISSNQTLLKRVARQLPEWNLSTFAQAAGTVCAREGIFIKETCDYVETERAYVTECLSRMGYRVLPSRSNFVLFYSDLPLYERLLEQGILIRDCSNFRGLSNGYYRIAIKSRQDNERLIKIMGAFK